MRALVQDCYGPPDVLTIRQVPTPVLAPGEVLVRVLASSVNARDWHVMRGEPRVARLLDRSLFGRRGPREPVRGTDFAGVVESVGPADTPHPWRPGDRVFGEAPAALADLVAVPADQVAAVPRGVTFQQAATLPLAASTAALCVEATGAVPGQRVLVNGASGGVGTFAIQLARHRGLHVTAVCSSRNAGLATALGAQTVVDYRTEDFAARTDRYHAVVDLVGNRSVADLRRVLTPSGTLVLSGGGVSGEGRLVGPLALLARAALASKLTGTRLAVPGAEPDAERLRELGALVASSIVTPVIDRVFPFDKAAEAIRYLEIDHARGKVVVSHDPRSTEEAP